MPVEIDPLLLSKFGPVLLSFIGSALIPPFLYDSSSHDTDMRYSLRNVRDNGLAPILPYLALNAILGMAMATGIEALGNIHTPEQFNPNMIPILSGLISAASTVLTGLFVSRNKKE